MDQLAKNIYLGSIRFQTYLVTEGIKGSIFIKKRNCWSSFSIFPICLFCRHINLKRTRVNMRRAYNNTTQDIIFYIIFTRNMLNIKKRTFEKDQGHVYKGSQLLRMETQNIYTCKNAQTLV